MNNILLNEGYNLDKIIFSKADGVYIYDINGKQYLDTTIGSGTHILGHNHPIVINALKQQLNHSLLFTTNNSLAYDVAELIQKCVPNIDNVVFCNTGSEATMRAARIARAYTKKKKIAIFSGAWHGGNELFMYDFNYDIDDGNTYHKSSGVPNEFKDLVIVLPYNDRKAFEIIEQNKDDIAMVIVEPSQGSNPRNDMKLFLENLREITQENNIILCFDEMITGFRIKLGGAQEYYNIKADLVTYGKTVGGGLPIGIVAGQNKFMRIIKGDENNLPVFMGGTFSANPMSMASAKALLNYLLINQNIIYPKLEKDAYYIKTYINNYCIENKIPVQMIGINSMLRFIFTDYPIKSRQDRDKYEISTEKQNIFYDYLLKEKKIFVNGNRIIFLSILSDDEIITFMIESFIDAINYLQKL